MNKEQKFRILGLANKLKALKLSAVLKTGKGTTFLLEENSDKASRAKWKEILQDYAEYIIPEIYAYFNQRQGKYLTTYTPIEEIRESDYYQDLKDTYDSLDKLPKSFVNKLYSLETELESEDLEEYRLNSESFKDYIGEFGSYLFASGDSFIDWLDRLDDKMWRESHQEEIDKWKQEKEEAIKRARFNIGDLVKFKNKIFKVRDIKGFDNNTLEYILEYPDSKRQLTGYTIMEDDLEVASKKELKNSSVLKTDEGTELTNEDLEVGYLLRELLSEENDATASYLEKARKFDALGYHKISLILLDIAQEELHHAGELQKLLDLEDMSGMKEAVSGAEEVEEAMSETIEQYENQE